MSIRIECHFYGSTTVIDIAGRLTGDGVIRLREAFDQAGVPCVIDLSNLLYADDEGIETIKTIIGKGARIQGASPFIALLLGNGSR